MGRIPDYVGVSAFGIKMGVVVPGSDIAGMVCEALAKCDADGLLDDGDTACITESVVARAQNNYVTVEDIAIQVREKLNITPESKVGVIFPILSRNRFSLILKGIAAAVPKGEVIVQLSYPADEVGNQILPYDFAEKLGKHEGDIITLEEIGNDRFLHPITQVDYIELYEKVITGEGAKATIFLCNDPLAVMKYNPDGVVVANIHVRHRTAQKFKDKGYNCITLQNICNEGEAWSEWGLLGSNLSSGDKLKLAPREADKVADEVKAWVRQNLGKDIEVIIYGDGAYRDPSTGIYELADPQPAFGMTKGLRGKYREGLKYKYLVDKMIEEGVDREKIEEELNAMKKDTYERNSFETEGTTPRKVEDLMASLADLVSGSADAGTPLILIKGFLG
ncbi:coenzyme F420-0:L-glutamate ligase [Thermosyntropha sp.]|uniref:coenzyme F420-0:L-glutamate ligase n=1 Tax=Thermosyntropha sp. TaxID=2740820 RepID=UPI0025D86955|nr:coenzyme F420-0:L-glutamate ligase [Thermosyntropha sp.]MBO8159826.1 coenzyme F420-0:L-glutamate ligase [Thermosyntropha sp.]